MERGVHQFIDFVLCGCYVVVEKESGLSDLYGQTVGRCWRYGFGLWGFWGGGFGGREGFGGRGWQLKVVVDRLLL